MGRVNDYPDGGIPADDTVVLVQKTNGDLKKTTMLNIHNAFAATLAAKPSELYGLYTPIITNYDGNTTWDIVSIKVARWKRYGDIIELQASFELKHRYTFPNTTRVWITLPTNKEGTGSTMSVISAINPSLKKNLYCVSDDDGDFLAENTDKVRIVLDDFSADVKNQYIEVNMVLTYEVKDGE